MICLLAAIRAYWVVEKSFVTPAKAGAQKCDANSLKELLINLNSSPRRRPGPRAIWIPACAGKTFSMSIVAEHDQAVYGDDALTLRLDDQRIDFSLRHGAAFEQREL